MTVVDVWAQITTPRMAEQPWMATLLRWIGRAGDAVVPTDRDTLAAMDDAGVDLALLSAWYGPTGALVSNDEVQRHLDAHPDRFRGLASADVRFPADAVREVRDRLADDRFVGVRIVPWLWEVPPTDRRFYPLYVACIEAGVPLCTQIGHTGPLRPSETGRLIPYLEQVMLDFPELVVVGGHVGYPWIDEVRSMTAKFENFYVDTSAYALHRLPPGFVEYLHGLGARRTMFGTNWPMLSPTRCLQGLESLGLDDDHRDAFLGGTAERVFALGGARS
ncbi:MAG: amidohydrolase [Acidimicrobiaceae bacterium]|nr:amidohydrolase [Acidimicrobiaceae bacterium]